MLLFFGALTLVLQSAIAWLAWRIGAADKSFRCLAIGLTLMAGRRTTALAATWKSQEAGSTATWLNVADRELLPLTITVTLGLFVFMHQRRMAAWVVEHAEDGARLEWPTRSLKFTKRKQPKD